MRWFSTGLKQSFPTFVYAIIYIHPFPSQITANISVSDDSSQEISAIVNKVKKLCPHGNDPSSPSHKASLVGVVTIASLLAILYAYWSNYHRL